MQILQKSSAVRDLPGGKQIDLKQHATVLYQAQCLGRNLLATKRRATLLKSETARDQVLYLRVKELTMKSKLNYCVNFYHKDGYQENIFYKLQLTCSWLVFCIVLYSYYSYVSRFCLLINELQKVANQCVFTDSWNLQERRKASQPSCKILQ